MFRRMMIHYKSHVSICGLVPPVIGPPPLSLSLVSSSHTPRGTRYIDRLIIDLIYSGNKMVAVFTGDWSLSNHAAWVIIKTTAWQYRWHEKSEDITNTRIYTHNRGYSQIRGHEKSEDKIDTRSLSSLCQVISSAVPPGSGAFQMLIRSSSSAASTLRGGRANLRNASVTFSLFWHEASLGWH